MYVETDPHALRVLERSLSSTSRATRLRAVAMLACVECSQRERWLQTACGDRDPGVRETALVVLSWVLSPAEPPWPDREDPSFDRVPDLAPEPEAAFEAAASFRWRWEYAIEVWRGDGMLVGVFLSTACDENDEHAKHIALGQAILASTTAQGDFFDPARAAAFIVGKRRVQPDLRSSGEVQGGS